MKKLVFVLVVLAVTGGMSRPPVSHTQTRTNVSLKLAHKTLDLG